jgi:outer membrane biosynthesis protein TonB
MKSERFWIGGSALVHGLLLVALLVWGQFAPPRVIKPIAVHQIKQMSAKQIAKAPMAALPPVAPPEPEPGPAPEPEAQPEPEPRKPEKKKPAPPEPKPEPKKTTPKKPTPKPPPKKTTTKKPKVDKSVAKKPAPKPPAPVAKTAPAPKKTATAKKPEATAKKSEPKKSVAKSGSGSGQGKGKAKGLTAAQKAALTRAQESIAKIGAATDKGSHSAALSVPAAISSLHIDSGEGGGVDGAADAQADYYRDVGRRIKSALSLTDYGDVKVQLTIDANGHIEKMSVVQHASSTNRDYIAKVLPSVRLPPLGPYFPGCKRLTCTLILSNEE